MKTLTEQPLARFQVEHFELHVGTVEVEANSAAEAIMRFLNGDGTMLVGSEYVGPCTDKGVPLEEYPELRQELESHGLRLQKILPSIRSVRQLSQTND